MWGDGLPEQDDDRAWAKQLGPVYRQPDVARMLGKSKQAVSADKHLLRLTMRNGDIGYPVFQFDGRRQLPGVGEIVALLAPLVATPWTVASWLTSPQPTLEGARPLDLLADGQVEEAVAAAHRLATALAA